MDNTAIHIRNLTKTYNKLKAVDDLSLEIFSGEVFGLLGPNGAGKTTTVEILEGLRNADHGEITILGRPVPDQIKLIKQQLGMQLQTTNLPEMIRVEELLTVFASYYQSSVSVKKIMDEMGIAEKRKSFVKHLSGGQNQRLAMALALINDPEILILDEPTTGLDPQARRSVWEIIRKRQESDKTILLTTHYMEEAEQLCDRVGIIDHGKIIALGSPKELIERQNLATAIEFDVGGTSAPFDKDQFSDIEDSYQEGNHIMLFSRNPQNVLIKLVRALDQGTLPIQQISVRKASLEDVFIELTGRKLRDS